MIPLAWCYSTTSSLDGGSSCCYKTSWGGHVLKKKTHGLEGDPDDTKQLIDLRTGPDVIKQLVDLRGVMF